MRPERENKRDFRKEKPKKEFEELLLEVRRVTRVTTGGRRLSFRATILVGNRKGKIWLGVAKGNDVASAIQKASNEAYKNMFEVPLARNNSVPYPITQKYKACIVRLLPASEGTGLKAGSSIRSVLALAGYSNILSKMIGSNNKLNNALATIKALSAYKHADYFSSLNTSNDEVVEENEVKKEDQKESVKKEEKAKVVKAKKVASSSDEKKEKVEKDLAKKAAVKKEPEKKAIEKKASPKKVEEKKEVKKKEKKD